MPAVHPDRTPAAAVRLTKALGVLKRRKGDATAHQGATISELCRLGGVSRNAVYRYHPTILAELRRQQGRTFRTPGQWASSAGGTDQAALQDQVSKLAALVERWLVSFGKR